MLLLGSVILELLLGLVSDGGAYLSRCFNLQRYSYSLPAVGGRTNEKGVKLHRNFEGVIITPKME